MHDHRVPIARIRVWYVPFCLSIAAMVICAVDTSARVIKSRRPSPQGETRGITVASGFEYQSYENERTYELPFLIEYTLSKRMLITAELNYQLFSVADEPDSRGLGDLETRVTLDVITERRNRPSYTLIGTVTWPTASSDVLGARTAEPGFGVSLSKEFVCLSCNAEAVYHLTGSSGNLASLDVLEFSLAAESHISRWLDFIGEVRTTQDIGKSHLMDTLTSTYSPDKKSIEYGFTIGFAEQIRRNVKLEQGILFQTDGSWQALVAWEWEIGGD